MNNDYKYTPEELYAHTNKGLDILYRYEPACIGCMGTKNFKFNKGERSASASLFIPKGENFWAIKDFSSGEFITPIQLVQKYTGKEFGEALKDLYAEFNVPTTDKVFQSNVTFREDSTLPENYWKIIAKPKIENPQVYSRFVTAELLESFGIIEIEYTERRTKSGKIMRVTNTPAYPMFAYSDNYEQWAKTYCPKEANKAYKHSYFGQKPTHYVHGYKRILDKIGNNYERIMELQKRMEKPETSDLEKEMFQEELDEMLLPYIIICSGGSDGVSVASLSEEFNPVWCNSEAEIITPTIYHELKKLTKNLINLPDLDPSGIKFAYKYSLQYWKLPTAFLPNYYFTDEDGNPKGKDFRDYLLHRDFTHASKEYITKKIKEQLSVAVSCDFVMLNQRKQYRVNARNLFYFLNCHNFFGYKPEFVTDKNPNETDDILIQINKHKIKVPTSKDIRQYCQEFLIRQGTSPDVLEMLEKTNALRASDLVNLPARTLDFTNYGADYQIFFFDNISVKVTATELRTVTDKDITCYVWDKHIINNRFTALPSFFEMYQDEAGNQRVHIHQTACEFMNFIINGSRVHWETEKEENPDFRKAYILNSPHLTEEQQITQERHFLGKCFAIGYLLHKYKKRGFEKYVYVMDDKVKDSVTENNGRSGKGLMINGLRELAPYFYRGGKNPDLFRDKHLFGTYKGEPLIYFDDLHASIPFSEVYTYVTDGITVNEKTKGDYHIPYEKAPKMVGTYNHAIRNMTSSDIGRILFVTFSDYYYFSLTDKFQPIDDFGHAFFQDWDEKQYNLFYNFMLQCLQFFLANQQAPVLSPIENLQINTLKASIGDNFMEWAEEYFCEENLNREILKKEMYDDYRNVVGKMAVQIKNFKKNIALFCQLKSYVFNPKELCNSQGYIKRTVYNPDNNRTTKEYFFVGIPKDETNPNPATNPHNTPITPPTTTTPSDQSDQSDQSYDPDLFKDLPY